VRPSTHTSRQLCCRCIIKPQNQDQEVSNESKSQAKLLGRFIVADPDICHGKPTFRGTRIFVPGVLEMVAEGMAWETIIEHWHHRITKEAIAEAVKLSSEAFFKHADEFTLEPSAA
jgi:uncharacterized protein (DUF433 family)